MSKISKLLNEINSEDNLFINEMNPSLFPEDTGISKGKIMYRSKEFQSKEINHGPSVKYYPISSDEIVITIADSPVVEENEETFNLLHKKLKKAVKLFISLNKENLLDYWNKGSKFSPEDIKNWKNKIIKIK